MPKGPQLKIQRACREAGLGRSETSVPAAAAAAAAPASASPAAGMTNGRTSDKGNDNEQCQICFEGQVKVSPPSPPPPPSSGFYLNYPTHDGSGTNRWQLSPCSSSSGALAVPYSACGAFMTTHFEGFVEHPARHVDDCAYALIPLSQNLLFLSLIVELPFPLPLPMSVAAEGNDQCSHARYKLLPNLPASAPVSVSVIFPGHVLDVWPPNLLRQVWQ